jgi:hypothetical protein
VASSAVYVLDLSLNPNIIGPIPDSIGSIGSLYSFALAGTSINGTLPESIGDLSNLDTMSLSNTYISGAAPASLSRLSTLASLDVANAQISGPSWLNAISSLKMLKVVDFRNNALSGSIPEGFGANLTSLSQLSLSNNNLTGPIPSSFARMKSLKYLDLGNNKMSGTIPLSVSYQLPLLEVTISGNSFSGCFDQPMSISSPSTCQVDSSLCGCTRAGCGLAICPPNPNSCSGASPFSGAVCYNGRWIIPSSIILQGNNVSISSPTSIAGDLVILTTNSTLSVKPLAGSSGPLVTVDGCVTLNGLLEVSLNKSSLTGAPGTVDLLSYGGFCNGNESRFALLLIDTECGNLTNARLDYRSRSMVLLFDGYDASSCGGSAVSGLSPTTLGLIIGCTLGGILLIGIVVLVIAFTVPAVGNKLMPWRARRKLAGVDHSDL